jgi:hypothetical protein
MIRESCTGSVITALNHAGLATLPASTGLSSGTIQTLPGHFVDAQRWYAMTTARVFGIYQGSKFNCSPLDVRQWRWGDFKHAGRSDVEVATLALANGTHTKVSYETGPAAMGPIYYERFWTIKYPVLGD